MAKVSSEEINQLHAEVCQALADPTRIAILYELSDGEKNVGELAEALGCNRVTVSRHLRVLRERAIVRTERRGVSIYYSLADQRIIAALDLLRQVLAQIMATHKMLAEALE